MQNNLQFLHDNNHIKIHNEDYSGGSLQIFKTVNSGFDFTINGKSTQNTSVQGKNLLDLNTIFKARRSGTNQIIPIGDVSWSIVGSTVTFTPTSNFDGVGFLVPVNGATQITVSAVNANFLNARYGLYNLGVNKEFLSTIIEGGSLALYTTTTSVNAKYLAIVIATSVAAQCSFSDLQVELGAVKTAFVPFIPNSPSPNYPSAINSVDNVSLISRNYSSIIKYNSTIWDGWSRTGITTVDDTGMEITVYDQYVAILFNNLQAKPSTNYGILFNVISNGLTKNMILEAGAFPNASVTFVPSGFTGIRKMVLTSLATIQYNRFAFKRSSSEPSPNKIKLKDIRVIELPVGSQLESDFNTMTAEQLDQKYPFISSENVKSNSVTFPYTLRSLPNGVCDTIEIDNVAKTAKLIQAVGIKVFDGTEVWNVWSTSKSNTISPYYVFTTGTNFDRSKKIVSTHFIQYNMSRASDIVGITMTDGGTSTATLNIPITIATDVTTWKAWLSAQYTVGSPVVYNYEMSIPQEIILDYNAIIQNLRQYYPYTEVCTNSIIYPTLDGIFKIIGK